MCTMFSGCKRASIGMSGTTVETPTALKVIGTGRKVRQCLRLCKEKVSRRKQLEHKQTFKFLKNDCV